MKRDGILVNIYNYNLFIAELNLKELVKEYNCQHFPLLSRCAYLLLYDN